MKAIIQEPPTGLQENWCQFLSPNPSCSSFISVAMMKHLNKQFWEEGVFFELEFQTESTTVGEVKSESLG